MVRMTSFDADTVRRWLRRAADADDAAMPHWGIALTAQEVAALDAGGARLAAALDETPVEGAALGSVLGDDWGAADAEYTELPARMLRRYLDAFAAGVGSTRLAFAGADQDDRVSAPTGDVGALALVAGMNAAAAALHGEISSTGPHPTEQWRSAEQTAAESARLAGFAAAELVVDGAGLHEIAAAAAGAATNGWRVGVPGDPVERVEYRIRGLVGLLLIALEVETRDPEPPGEPAPCGALPGENLGHSFLAEITFTMGLPTPEVRLLSNEIVGLGGDLTVWPGSQWPRFHVHTDRVGEVLSQVFAYGTPFDLQVTSRD